mmetsp:Transcript_1784/g.2010  ORF Transcript_1784/g.2010 Transcript_1784/m.2010 type:complete len:156 (+) Transcript_1784:237-704(+)
MTRKTCLAHSLPSFAFLWVMTMGPMWTSARICWHGMAHNEQHNKRRSIRKVGRAKDIEHAAAQQQHAATSKKNIEGVISTAVVAHTTTAVRGKYCHYWHTTDNVWTSTRLPYSHNCRICVISSAAVTFLSLHSCCCMTAQNIVPYFCLAFSNDPI